MLEGKNDIKLPLPNNLILTLYRMPDLRHMHYADITVRFNGKNLHFEADWLKQFQHGLRHCNQVEKQMFIDKANEISVYRYEKKCGDIPSWLEAELV